MKRKIVIISGPTASHKSILADLVKNEVAVDAAIVNIDSMQVYDSLPILTALPKNFHENFLFAYKKFYNKCSAGIWLEDFNNLVSNELKNKELIIVVGGTGLYIKSLIYGLSNIPSIPSKVRSDVLKKFDKDGREEFYKFLCDIDPKCIKKIHPSDKQRMLRAAEVVEHTGRSIYSYSSKNIQNKEYNCMHLSLTPDRDYLYNNCNIRFKMMCEEGAVEEVIAFSTLVENKGSHMIEKALGYQDLYDYLCGKTDFGSAVESAQQKTRNYAKRQMTWFRSQKEAKLINFDRYSSHLEKEVLLYVSSFIGGV
ncbi:MAG: tRNA (adenosine(37)-N6)-dimethylallyltransferase MiaA [Rickettsiales bacterium]